MQHHVYSVWDFMSLIKYLHHEIAPARWPWTPAGETSTRFVQDVAAQGIDAALCTGLAPAPSVAFTRTPFDFLASGKPHAVAAVLALGHEHVIPSMFRAFLSRMTVTESQAPSFHCYLKRHVHLDEDFHAPLSQRLLAARCGDDASKWREAETAAETAVQARLQFWDGVLAALPNQVSQAA